VRFFFLVGAGLRTRVLGVSGLRGGDLSAGRRGLRDATECEESSKAKRKEQFQNHDLGPIEQATSMLTKKQSWM